MNSIANPVVSRTINGGYSGTLTVTVGTGNEGAPPMVFVESDVLASTFVLSLSEAGDLGFAISAAVAEAEHLLNTGEASQA